MYNTMTKSWYFEKCKSMCTKTVWTNISQTCVSQRKAADISIHSK